MSKRNRRDKILSILKKKGFTREQAAGIVGSLQGENDTFDPARDQGSGGPGFGIAQWEGVRLAELKKRKGFDTLDVQVGFIVDELRGKVPEGISGFSQKLSKRILAGSSEDIARNFTKFYERPRTSAAENRVQEGQTGFTKEENKRGRFAANIFKDTVEAPPQSDPAAAFNTMESEASDVFSRPTTPDREDTFNFADELMKQAQQLGSDKRLIEAGKIRPQDKRF